QRRIHEANRRIIDVYPEFTEYLVRIGITLFQLIPMLLCSPVSSSQALSRESCLRKRLARLRLTPTGTCPTQMKSKGLLKY
ncbi:MAG: hypothetical protein QXP36_11705, partial [Conexivisphaerales archaeon]